MKVKVKVKSLSCVRLFATLWTVAYQAPLFMGFSRQEYWSGLPFPSPGDLPDPGIKPGSRVAGRRFNLYEGYIKPISMSSSYTDLQNELMVTREKGRGKG